jgi:hypothetical protein
MKPIAMESQLTVGQSPIDRIWPVDLLYTPSRHRLTFSVWLSWPTKGSFGGPCYFKEKTEAWIA